MLNLNRLLNVHSAEGIGQVLAIVGLASAQEVNDIFQKANGSSLIAWAGLALLLASKLYRPNSIAAPDQTGDSTEAYAPEAYAPEDHEAGV